MIEERKVFYSNITGRTYASEDQAKVREAKYSVKAVVKAEYVKNLVEQFHALTDDEKDKEDEIIATLIRIGVGELDLNDNNGSGSPRRKRVIARVKTEN